MALVKCPECGRERVSENAEMCPNCGYGIKNHYEKIKQQEKERHLAEDREKQRILEAEKQRQLTKEREKKRQEMMQKYFGSPIKKLAWVLVAFAVFITVVVAIGHENAKKCSLASCSEYKKNGSNYCREHSCSVNGCVFSKSKYESYCFTHQKEILCTESDCDSKKVSGGMYCSTHTCDENGCYEIVYENNYCYTHKKDMRKLLDLDVFMIDRVNSAGGIEMRFGATNKSTKEIKYVRFYVQLFNAVGDRIEDEITDKNEVYVEIVGPAKYNQSIEFDDIIGYNDTCDRIEIDNITIVYMDGTTYSGWYGYYDER